MMNKQFDVYFILGRGQLNELALFAGNGGGILGGKLLGWRTVCAVEKDQWCIDRLLQRQSEGFLPYFPIWDDIRTFDGRPFRGLVDVVSGGFPCQDISTAGKGAGIEGERSGLWSEMARIIREVGPPIVFVENVAALTVRGLSRVLGDLAEMGFNARWGVLGGFHVGNICNGERLWIVATQTDCSMLASVDLSEYIISSTEESCRRQYTRAVSKMLSQDDYSRIKRDTDVVASQMDRLRAIGNGQVPAVAATAFRLLYSS
jgi:DNA (cytosine-5)-methyltransferase 1